MTDPVEAAILKVLRDELGYDIVTEAYGEGWEVLTCTGPMFLPLEEMRSAAIKAHNEILMEPSDEMIAAGELAWNTRCDAGLVRHTGIKDAFQAMLSVSEKTDE